MNPPMHKRVRDALVDAGLTSGSIIQVLKWTDTGNLADSFIMFAPAGGTAIDKTISADYYVAVNIVSAKSTGAYERSEQMAQAIIDYVQQNPDSNPCLGEITNIGGFPQPILTADERMVWRIQLMCRYGE